MRGKEIRRGLRKGEKGEEKGSGKEAGESEYIRGLRKGKEEGEKRSPLASYINRCYNGTDGWFLCTSARNLPMNA